MLRWRGLSASNPRAAESCAAIIWRDSGKAPLAAAALRLTAADLLELKLIDGIGEVPVVMAGGPRCETEREVLEFVHDGMERGAVGLNLGRNVWQNRQPVAMMMALRAIIHERAGVEEAEDIYRRFGKKK